MDGEGVRIGDQTFVRRGDHWVDRKSGRKAPEGLTKILDQAVPKVEQKPEADQRSNEEQVEARRQKAEPKQDDPALETPRDEAPRRRFRYPDSVSLDELKEAADESAGVVSIDDLKRVASEWSEDRQRPHEGISVDELKEAASEREVEPRRERRGIPPGRAATALGYAFKGLGINVKAAFMGPQLAKAFGVYHEKEKHDAAYEEFLEKAYGGPISDDVDSSPVQSIFNRGNEGDPQTRRSLNSIDRTIKGILNFLAEKFGYRRKDDDRPDPDKPKGPGGGRRPDPDRGDAEAVRRPAPTEPRDEVVRRSRELFGSDGEQVVGENVSASSQEGAIGQVESVFDRMVDVNLKSFSAEALAQLCKTIQDCGGCKGGLLKDLVKTAGGAVATAAAGATLAGSGVVKGIKSLGASMFGGRSSLPTSEPEVEAVPNRNTAPDISHVANDNEIEELERRKATGTYGPEFEEPRPRSVTPQLRVVPGGAAEDALKVGKAAAPVATGAAKGIGARWAGSLIPGVGAAIDGASSVMAARKGNLLASGLYGTAAVINGAGAAADSTGVGAIAGVPLDIIAGVVSGLGSLSELTGFGQSKPKRPQGSPLGQVTELMKATKGAAGNRALDFAMQQAESADKKLQREMTIVNAPQQTTVNNVQTGSSPPGRTALPRGSLNLRNY